MIPNCVHEFSDSRGQEDLGAAYNRVFTKTDYKDLCNLVTELLSNDCWAAVTTISRAPGHDDRSVIFSHYGDIAVRDFILDNMIRDKVTDDPHQIFVNFHRAKVDSNLTLYMFVENTWSVVFSYHATDQTYTIKCYAS